jgi:dTDP-4-amino-4,6-dideoxygalactose transaminase
LNYRLPDILCALGISQLQRLNEFKEKKKLVFKRYSEAFELLEHIKPPVIKADIDPMWHLYPIQVSPTKRESIFNELRNANIGVQVNYLPAHLHPVFSSLNLKGTLPISEAFYSREISLPMSAVLSESNLDWIIATVKKALLQCG